MFAHVRVSNNLANHENRLGVALRPLGHRSPCLQCEDKCPRDLAGPQELKAKIRRAQSHRSAQHQVTAAVADSTSTNVTSRSARKLER